MITDSCCRNNEAEMDDGLSSNFDTRKPLTNFIDATKTPKEFNANFHWFIDSWLEISHHRIVPIHQAYLRNNLCCARVTFKKLSSGYCETRKSNKEYEYEYLISNIELKQRLTLWKSHHIFIIFFTLWLRHIYASSEI